VEPYRVVARRHPLRHAPAHVLDVSVQAVILKLPVALRCQLGMSFLFVSPDLYVVQSTRDRAPV
jgi:ABC-type microcin C transport system duplicated ATPase subunit YejF